MPVKNGGKMTRLFTRVIVATVIVFAFASFVLAQDTNDAVKVEMYQRFVDNRLPHPDIAYQAARDYLQKYANDKDKYAEYLGKWALAYERDERKRILPVLINQKNFAQAYRVGAQILADEPDYLRAQIDLGYAGYLAASAKDETHNEESLAYSQKAIQAIESAKTTDWAPFKGKDDTLAYLYYSRGYLTLKTNHYDESIDALLKAAAFETDIRKTASTYYFLAVAYESGPYKTLSNTYQSTYAGKPETPESKAALEKLNVVMDRIIDAYARAIATAGTDPKTQQSRKEWLDQMTTYYKFRHDGSDVGETEFIANVIQSPVPSKP